MSHRNAARASQMTAQRLQQLFCSLGHRRLLGRELELGQKKKQEAARVFFLQIAVWLRPVPRRMRAHRYTLVALGLLLVLLVLFYDASILPKLSTEDVLRTNIQKTTRIRYRLHHDRASVFNNIYGRIYQCGNHSSRPRKAEPAEIYNTAGILNFGTTVETDLNLIFMGDSVGIQFSQAFEEAAAVRQRQVLRYMEPKVVRYEGLHLSATASGGWVAGWRLTGMLLREGENMPLPNEPGGGWDRQDAVQLLEIMKADNSQTSSFDTMIFRVIQGWIPLNNINNQTLTETIELAHEMFGVNSIIFVSLPLCNNYMESADVVELLETNQRLLEFAQNWRSGNSGVEHVLVLDFARLAWLLISWNAKLLNFTGPMVDVYPQRLATFLPHEFFPAAEAHVCSERKDPTTGDCVRNYLTFDGMHWCMETIEGRLMAGIACLLACINNNGSEPKQTCAQRCNDQYMSLEPIPDDKFGASLS